jgi:hypothetical protein
VHGWRVTKHAILIALAIGCGGSSPKPPTAEPMAVKPVAPTCLEMAEHLTKVMARDDQKASAQEVAQVVDVYKLRCGEDRWSDEVRECYGMIQVDTDVAGCGERLSPEQKSSFERANMASLEKEKANQDALLRRFEDFADQACKCKAGEQECAKKVSDEMTRWADSQAPDSVPIRPDPRIDVAAEKLSKCIAAALMKAEPAKPERKTRGGAMKKQVPKSSSDPDLGGE